MNVENLKPGDNAVTIRRNGFIKCIVKRTTATMVEVELADGRIERYRRKDGNKVGGNSTYWAYLQIPGKTIDENDDEFNGRE